MTESGEASEPDGIETFDVTVESYADQQKRKWTGKATLTVGTEGMTVSGKSPITVLPFPLFYRKISDSVPIDHIANVTHDATRIAFHRVRDGATQAVFVLRFGSEGAAARVAQRLPATQSEAYTDVQKQHAAFAGAIQVATPHAWVTPILIAVNVAVLVLMGISGVGWVQPSPARMLEWGADYWLLTTGGEWWRLLTSAFLHFGVVHLALNMWALGCVGTLTERLYGNVWFIVIYVFAALTSSLASAWWEPHAVEAGASGAIFGVYGALLAYVVAQRGSFPTGAAGQLMNSTLGFVFYNVLYGMSRAGISNAAHLGGLAGGFLLGLVMARPLDMERRRRQTAGRMTGGVVFAAGMLGAILGWIPKSGYDAAVETAFAAARAEVASGAQTLDERFSEWVKDAQDGKLSDADLADLLDREKVSDRWGEYARRLSSISLSTHSPSRPARDVLVRICEARRDACRTLSEALRSGDKTKLKKFQDLMAKAQAAFEELSHADADPGE